MTALLDKSEIDIPNISAPQHPVKEAPKESISHEANDGHA